MNRERDWIETTGDLAEMLQRFLDGSAGPWDWDDFTSVPERNPVLESYRQRLLSEVDPLLGNADAQPELTARLEAIIQELRADAKN